MQDIKCKKKKENKKCFTETSKRKKYQKKRKTQKKTQNINTFVLVDRWVLIVGQIDTTLCSFCKGVTGCILFHVEKIVIKDTNETQNR